MVMRWLGTEFESKPPHYHAVLLKFKCPHDLKRELREGGYSHSMVPGGLLVMS